MVQNLDRDFWKSQRIFLTGHTSFKGSWLIAVLEYLGSDIKGYSKFLPSKPSLFNLTKFASKYPFSENQDILDLDYLNSELSIYKPSVVIHFAAQSLVRKSYDFPIETFKSNIIGTANVLQSALENNIKRVLIITTDKVYKDVKNKTYSEDDIIWGSDPYASSKACAELVTDSYIKSFFNNDQYVATARSGNVIGGGDFSEDRIIPDIFKSIKNKTKLQIRSPNAIRPWQHVLEPIFGYLKLIENMHLGIKQSYNFGPRKDDFLKVIEIVELLKSKNPELSYEIIDQQDNKKESKTLKLDSSSAINDLKWKQVLNINEAIDLIQDWKNIYTGKSSDAENLLKRQLNFYMQKF